MREEHADAGFERRLKALFTDLRTPDNLSPERLSPRLAGMAPAHRERRKALSIAAMFAVVVALGGLSVALLRPNGGFGEGADGAAVPYGDISNAAQESATGAPDQDVRLPEAAVYGVEGADDGSAQDACGKSAGEATPLSEKQSGKKYDDCLDGCVGDDHVPECPHYGEGGE